MVEVIACVVGGTPSRLSAATVGDLKRKLGLPSNYTATVNGEPADDAAALSQEDFVSLAAAVKGG